MDLALQVRGDYPTLLDTARFSEANGLVAMALPDHYLASRTNVSDPAHDALTQLGGLARETETLELSIRSPRRGPRLHRGRDGGTGVRG